MKKTIFGLATCALFASPALAATEQGQFAIHGYGSLTCEGVVQKLKADQSGVVRAGLVSWISGYIDATNRNSASVYDVTPVANHAGVAALAVRICERNSATPFENVVAAVVKGFEPMRVSQVGAPVVWKNGDKQVTIPNELLGTIQSFLVKGKFLDRKYADGSVNLKTISSFASWQASKSIDQSGLPDAVSLFAMAQDIAGAGSGK